MWLEMKVKGLALDPLSNMPIIILRDEEDKRSLPIWVGLFEANAIALELEKIPTARPMTHDLIKNILETLDARVAKVVVNDLRENTFFAVIHCSSAASDITVDSRPSDAIALALRVGAPIFVDEEVIAQGQDRRGPVAKEPEGGGKGRRSREDQGVAANAQARRFRQARGRQRSRAGRTSSGCGSALFTNNYLPFRGGVTTAVETLRQGLEAARPRGLGLRARGLGSGRRSAVRLPLSRRFRPRPIPAFACRCRSRRASARRRRRPRTRRRPRPAPVPARRDRAPARPPAGPAAGLHLSHALREVRALRAAARSAWCGRAGGRCPPASPPRADRGGGALGGGSRDDAARARRPDADRGRAHGRGPRPVPPGRPRRGAPATLGCPPTAPLCLYVGRLDREKSVDRVLDAFERIAAAVPRRGCCWSGRGRTRPSAAAAGGASRGRRADPLPRRAPARGAAGVLPGGRPLPVRVRDGDAGARAGGGAGLRRSRRWPSGVGRATRSCATARRAC